MMETGTLHCVLSVYTRSGDSSNGQPRPVRRLFETLLTVSDLRSSIDFYRQVVGLPLALEVPERNTAFFWVGDSRPSLLGLWSLGTAPMGPTPRRAPPSSCRALPLDDSATPLPALPTSPALILRPAPGKTR